MPPKLEYGLSEFGNTLIVLIQCIGLWGDENRERLGEVTLNHNETFTRFVKR
jgi:DNA-binding HxlR family transcriptional regulator